MDHTERQIAEVVRIQESAGKVVESCSQETERQVGDVVRIREQAVKDVESCCKEIHNFVQLVTVTTERVEILENKHSAGISSLETRNDAETAPTGRCT